MDPATILLIIRSLQQLTVLSVTMLNAIESIKHGNPDDVDLESLKQQVMNLPDLPTLKEIERSAKKELTKSE